MPGPGFYRIRAELIDHAGPVHHYDLTTAVLGPQDYGERSEFGWTMPDGGRPLSLFDLSKVVSQAKGNFTFHTGSAIRVAVDRPP